MKVAIYLIREAERSLPVLARHLERHADLGGVKALYGVSLIHRGPEAFGFSVIDLPRGPFRFFTTRYLRLLIRVMNPNGGELLRDRQARFYPRIMAMSMESFLKKYGSAAGDPEREASGALETAAGALPADAPAEAVLAGGKALQQ
jgi:hypothetical protein